jgi:ribosomal-protein-alanine N-acetyltransferase
VDDSDTGSAQFVVRSLTETDALAVATWHYGGEYAFYDWTADPDDLADLLDRAGWGEKYFAVETPDHGLAGFLAFTPEADAVEMGLGLRPDLTGRGAGVSFVLVGLEFAAQRFGAGDVVLRVAAFNTRAITVYQRTGFEVVAEYVHETNGGFHPFVLMRRTMRPQLQR